MEIIEIRHTKDHVRRRKKCRSCGHRETTREVCDEWYKNASESIRIVSSIKKQLNSTSLIHTQKPSTFNSSCTTCKHNQISFCDLDLPEYDSYEAEYCNYWVRNK